MSSVFAGYHPFGASGSEGTEKDAFVVFRVDKDWFWQRVDEGTRVPRGMICGPFPTDEGAYLSAIGD